MAKLGLSEKFTGFAYDKVWAIFHDEKNQFV
jgi:hypothetical protein